MEFSRILLDNYLQTWEGKQILEFFRELPDVFLEGDPYREINQFVHENLQVNFDILYYEENGEDAFSGNDFDTGNTANYQYGSSGELGIENAESLTDNVESGIDTCDDLQESAWDALEECSSIEMIEDLFQSIISEELEENYTSYRDVANDVSYISLFAHALCPDCFFPYLFPHHFFKVIDICELLGIILPPFPKRSQYQKKCMYYIELCRLFYDFRKQHSLSIEEFCAVFYGLALHLIPDPKRTDLPKPLKAYISGAQGHSYDHDFIANANENSTQVWQGNIDTQVGDIILMYETSPYSCISSIWRAIAPGFYDPFKYYHGSVIVGKPIKIPPISLDELKNDPVWAQKNLIRSNMQGVAGRPCSYGEYQAILGMLEVKGFDTSILPCLPQTTLDANIVLHNEKDVEEQLLEPFLKRLGFSSDHWVRQMPLRMGRGYNGPGI